MAQHSFIHIKKKRETDISKIKREDSWNRQIHSDTEILLKNLCSCRFNP
jgi:hypothetical protein